MNTAGDEPFHYVPCLRCRQLFPLKDTKDIACEIYGEIFTICNPCMKVFNEHYEERVKQSTYYGDNK